MRIITKQWSHLAAGYAEMAKLEKQAPGPGATPPVDQARQQQALKLWRWVLIGSALATLTVVLAWLSIPLALVAGFMYWQTRKRTHAPAQPPPAGLRERWWNSLADETRVEVTKEGDAGETDLLRRLDAALPDAYIAIRGIPVARNLDADILLLGPTGLWILESKFWSGRISYQDGVWRRQKQYYAPGGTPVQEAEVIDWGFDQQWQRERQELEETLARRLARHAGWLTQLIQGGVVFTHPKVTLDIDPSCPVKCVNTEHWIRQISTARSERKLTREIQLEVLDALLSYADSLDATTSRSAVDLARSLQHPTRSTAKHPMTT